MFTDNGSIEELVQHIRSSFHSGSGAFFLMNGGRVVKVYMAALDHFEGAPERGMLVAVEGKGCAVITDPKRVNRFTLTTAGIPLRVADRLAPVIGALFNSAPSNVPMVEQADAPIGAAMRIEDHGGSTRNACT